MVLQAFGIAIAAIISFLALFSVIWTIIRVKKFDASDKHIFITGGSTGLGLALAKKYASAGGKISIVSRSKSNLEAAKKEIELAGCRSVFIFSADVTDYSQVKAAVDAANKFHGRVTDHVICNAGLSFPGYFAEQDIDVFHKQMDLNYFGCVHTVKATLPAMIERGTGGRVTFISSACGLLSFIGFSQYCATKYAVRGLAEALRNELQLYNISVAIFYPGSMETPSFEAEEKVKPAETKEIEGTCNLVSADDAAQSLIDGICSNQFAITNDVGIYVLRILSNGIAPRTNSFFEMMILPFLVIIQLGYGWYTDYVVLKSSKRLKKKQD